MIELPEAVTLAHQITAELSGKTIRAAIRGSAAHKFAFYSRSAEEYAAILPGKQIGGAEGYGPVILVAVEPGYVLVLGGGGERILLHGDARSVPKKHHLLLEFNDDTVLTVSVQGWGHALLLTRQETAAHHYVGAGKISLLSDSFSLSYFHSLFSSLPAGDNRSAKYFIISEPGVWGVGNGYLQDILFRAKIHPRRRATSLTRDEQTALYNAVRTTLGAAVRLGGRDTERDLYNVPGRYRRLVNEDQPCPECGTRIEKSQYLGGAIYVCPRCQPLINA